MSASVSLLFDDFGDGVVSGAWNATAIGSATIAETGGQMRATLPSSTAGSHVARYTSRVTYDLTGGSFFININTMVATGVAATAFVQLYLDGGNLFQWSQLSGTLYARKVVAGVSTDLFSAAWSGTTYKYLKISESGGTITWWSSTNGTTWTSRATLVGLPFAITDLFVDFGAFCGNVASPGSFRLDDVNLLLPALTTAWNWTQIIWALFYRYKTITVATDATMTVMGYVVTADGVDASDAPSGNVRYWAGPMDAGRILTEQPSQAAAQAMAVYFPLDGRIDLPEMVECRIHRIYHRSADGASYTIRELYPRRLTQADDIEAESIRAIHIQAGSITADRLDVGQLSAITANAGTLTAGIIDGVTIYAGNRTVILDSTGLSFDYSHASLPSYAYLQWKTGAGIIEADLGSQSLVGFTTLDLATYNSAGTVALTQLRFRGDRATPTASFIDILVNGANPVTFDRLGVNASLINIGSISATGIGQLFTSGVAAIRGAAIVATTALNVKGTGTTNATAAISAINSGGLVDFQALDDGTIRTRTGNRVDFRGVTSGIATATKHWDVMIDGTLVHLLGY